MVVGELDVYGMAKDVATIVTTIAALEYMDSVWAASGTVWNKSSKKFARSLRTNVRPWVTLSN
jgi:hypothetical protein